MKPLSVCGVIVLGAVALLTAFGFTRGQRIARHINAWKRASGIAMGNPIPTLDRFYSWVIDKPPQHWWAEVSRHEAALMQLGYLTNCEFRLTNQIMTREFSSNFFRLLRQRTGTNDDQVWRCPYLTNGAGIAPTFPVKDYAIWEGSFRESAVLHASNLPPASALTVP